jgi:tetratricopeptide (TPR) repeat protein
MGDLFSIQVFLRLFDILTMENLTKRRSTWIAWTIGLLLGGNLLLIATVGTLAWRNYYLPFSTYQALETDAPWNTLNPRLMALQSPEDFSRTEAQLSKHAAHASSDPIPAFLLGSLYQARFDVQPAITHYQHAISRIEQASSGLFGDPRYDYFLNQAQANLALLNYLRNQPAKALKHAESTPSPDLVDNPALFNALRAVLEDPDRADFHYKLGIELQHAMHLPAARQEFETAMRLSSDPRLKWEAAQYLKVRMPSATLTVAPMALYYLQAGSHAQSPPAGVPANLDNAVAFYQKAIQAAPNFEWPYYHLGSAYHAMGKDNKAIEYNLKALKLNKDFYLPYLILGEISLDQENYPQAIQYYQQALALSEPLTAYHDSTLVANIQNQLGFAHEQQDSFQKALTHYQQALSVLDRSFTAYLTQQQDLTADADDPAFSSALDDLRMDSDDYQYALERVEELKSELKHLSARPAREDSV